VQGGGFVAAGLVFMCWLSANAFSHKLWDNDIKQHLPHQLAELEAWQAALVVHVTAWILQVRGRCCGFTLASHDGLCGAMRLLVLRRS
jgi:hypothetical protein